MRVLPLLLLLPACAADLFVGGGHTTDGTTTVFATLRDGDGVVIPAAHAELEVETAAPGRAWEPASGVTIGSGGSPVDAVLAVDNSGSVDWSTVALRAPVGRFAHALVDAHPSSRAGLVRISTEAELLQAPTADPAEIDAALDGMFVTNGWTALWDGIRVANEALAMTSASVAGKACGAAAFPAVIAVVDGVDNNSADEHASERYAGDGVDTDLSALLSLRAGDTYTTVHVVEMGDPAQDTPLRRLAAATGGAHLSATDADTLDDALTEVAALLDARSAVCFTPARCDDTRARIVARWSEGGHPREAVADAPIPAACR